MKQLNIHVINGSGLWAESCQQVVKLEYRSSIGSNWKGSQRVSSPTSSSKKAQLRGHTRALSTWVLKISKNRDDTTSLGTCYTTWPSSWEKNNLFTAVLNLSFQVMSGLAHPPTTHHCQEPVCLLYNLPSVTEGLLSITPLKPPLLQVEQAQFPQPVLAGQGF